MFIRHNILENINTDKEICNILENINNENNLMSRERICIDHTYKTSIYLC